MKEALTYFFGVGTEPEFSLFTPAHIAPVLAMLFAIWWIRKEQDAIRASRHEVKIRYILAFALIIADMAYYWRLAAAPWLSGGPMDRWRSHSVRAMEGNAS